MDETLTRRLRLAVEVAAGPLGVELEPAERRGRYAVGCRVTGFRKFDGGVPGQVEASGRIPLGAIVSAVDGEETLSMSFDKVMALLMRGVGKPRRTIEFVLPQSPPPSPQAAAANAAADAEAAEIRPFAAQEDGAWVSAPGERKAAAAPQTTGAMVVAGGIVLPQAEPPPSRFRAESGGSGGPEGMRGRPGAVVVSPGRGHGSGFPPELVAPLVTPDAPVATANSITAAAGAREEALFKASAAAARAAASGTAAASDSDGSDEELVLFDVSGGVGGGSYGVADAVHSGRRNSVDSDGSSGGGSYAGSGGTGGSKVGNRDKGDDGSLAATLARRLVAERRKREGLEEVASLQAEQIALLQRQANRTAILEELLADERHLSAALRADRQRVEDELTRALSALDAAAAAAAAAAPIVGAADRVASLSATASEAGGVGSGVGTADAGGATGSNNLKLEYPDALAGASVANLKASWSAPGRANSAPSPLTQPAAISVSANSGALAVTSITEAGPYSASDNGSTDTEAVAVDELRTPPRRKSSREPLPPPPAGALAPPDSDAAPALAEMATHLLVEKEAWVEERSQLRRVAAAASAQAEAMAAQLKGERAAAMLGEGPQLAALREQLAEKEQRAEYEAASAERLATEVERLNDFVLAKEAALASAAAELGRRERQLWEKDVESEQREVELRSLREASTIGETEKRLIADKASWARERNELLRELAELRQKLAVSGVPSATTEQLRRLRGEVAVARAAVAALRGERNALQHRLAAVCESTGAVSSGPESHNLAAGEGGDCDRGGVNTVRSGLQDVSLESPTLAAPAAVEGAPSDKGQQDPPPSGEDAASEADGHRTELDCPPTVAAMALRTAESDMSSDQDAWRKNITGGRRRGRDGRDLAFATLDGSEDEIDLLNGYYEAGERVEELLEQLEDFKDAALEGEEREQRVKDDADAAIRRLEGLMAASLPPILASPAGAAAAAASGTSSLPAVAALRGQLDSLRALADEREWEARRSERQAAESRRSAQRAAAAEAAAERRCRTLEREAAAQRRLTTTLRSRLAEAETAATTLGQRFREQEGLLEAERRRSLPQDEGLGTRLKASGADAGNFEAALAELRTKLAAQEAELQDIYEIADTALGAEATALAMPGATVGARGTAALARGGIAASRVLALRAAWERRGFELQRNQDAATAATFASTTAAAAAAAEVTDLKAAAHALRADLAAAREAAAAAACEVAAARGALQARSAKIAAAATDRSSGELAGAGLLRERDVALREQKRLLQAALEKAETARATTAKAVAVLASLEGVLGAAAATAEPPDANDSDWGGAGLSGEDAAGIERRAQRLTRKALGLASVLRRRGDELARAHSQAVAQELCLDDTRRRLEAALEGSAAAEAKARVAAEAEAEARAAAAAAAAAARGCAGTGICGSGGGSFGGTGPMPPSGRVSSNVLEQLRGEIEQVRRRNDGLRRELRGRSGSRAA